MKEFLDNQSGPECNRFTANENIELTEDFVIISGQSLECWYDIAPKNGCDAKIVIKGNQNQSFVYVFGIPLYYQFNDKTIRIGNTSFYLQSDEEIVFDFP